GMDMMSPMMGGYGGMGGMDMYGRRRYGGYGGYGIVVNIHWNELKYTGRGYFNWSLITQKKKNILLK
uniref:Uncharacterized protein n=1 Tax=Pristionchus pacificus TaxID=54126 RepID=A0A2A6C667_PRIPA